MSSLHRKSKSGHEGHEDGHEEHEENRKNDLIRGSQVQQKRSLDVSKPFVPSFVSFVPFFVLFVQLLLDA